MRKATLVLLLALLIACSLPWAASAGLRYTPHQNPETAQSAFAVPSLLSNYGIAMRLISEKDFSDAKSLLEQLKQAAIPAELKNAMDLYNSLTAETNEMLETIDELLQEVDSLINQQLLNDAGVKLDQAEDQIEEAESKLQDLTQATEAIGKQVGVLAGPDEQKIAYDALTDMLSRVDQLRDTYEQLRQELSQKVVEKQQQLTATSITLVLTPGETWVDENIIISGRLTDEYGNPLPDAAGKVITFIIAEHSWGGAVGAVTDGNGYYSRGITVPYLYLSSTTVKALWIPQGDDDKNTYQACSVSQDLTILFHQSQLEITDAPQEMYPGLAGTISGQVTSTGEVSERVLKASLEGADVGQALTDGEGNFQLEVTPPADIDLGSHTLRIFLIPKQKSSGEFQDIEVKVTKLVPEVVVQTSGFVFSSASLRVDGSVSWEGTPISGAAVNLSFSGTSATTTTSDDGTFSFDLSVPWAPIIGGSQSIDVTVVPSESWLGTTQAKASVLVLSPLNIALLSAALITIGVVLYRRRRHLVILTPEEEAFPESAEEHLIVAVEPKDSKEQVLATYYLAVRLVQESTGMLLQSQQTLREFLNEVEGHLGKVGESFAELTWRAEQALYSPSIPSAEEVAQAEQIAHSLERELSR